eukprot:4528624-Amphidinium_carterae.1
MRSCRDTQSITLGTGGSEGTQRNPTGAGAAREVDACSDLWRHKVRLVHSTIDCPERQLWQRQEVDMLDDDASERDAAISEGFIVTNDSDKGS